MAIGVDPIGPADEISAQGTIFWKVVVSKRSVLMILTVLVGVTTSLAPEKVAVVLRLIGL